MAGPTGHTKSARAGRRGSAAPRPPAASAARPPARDGRGQVRGLLRPRPRRPARRAVLLALAVAIALGGFAAWVLYGSAWLRVQRVSVSGTRVLTERQVSAAARIPLGIPVASVDKEAVARRLRAALPRIDEVSVVRAWPHGIGLQVTERTPELLVRKGGRYVEVDGSGVRFATVSRPPHGVPLLVMDVRRSAGSEHFTADRLRREAVRAAMGFPDAVARDTRRLRVRSYDSLTLELAGGRTIQWGSAERSAAKARTLTALMKAAPKADHYDVSVPSAPAASSS